MSSGYGHEVSQAEQFFRTQQEKQREDDSRMFRSAVKAAVMVGAAKALFSRRGA